MTSVIRWTTLAIAAAVILAFVSMLLGLRGGRGTLTGAPWVTLVLAFGLLNTVMLGVGIWVAHLVGPVTGDAAVADRTHAIYLPSVIASGVPLAAVAEVLVFGLTELIRWWRACQLPEAVREAYRSPALMGLLYAAWNDPTRRRAIGVLWDVGTFWPRSYHPLAPPCYSERAVPELQRRMWWLHDNRGRVVLVAHSQGAMLATAALVQPGCRPDGDHPSLITFGSPVVKLYGWGFPAYVTPQLLTALAPDGRGGVDDWCNQFYETDPIGGPVAVDLSRADGSPVDQDLLDPAECWYVYGQPAPTPQGHCGYWADPRVWAVVNGMAATRPLIPVASGAAPASA